MDNNINRMPNCPSPEKAIEPAKRRCARKKALPLPIEHLPALKSQWIHRLACCNFNESKRDKHIAFSISRRAFSQFWSFKIRCTTFFNYIQFVDPRIWRLRNWERDRRDRWSGDACVSHSVLLLEAGHKVITMAVELMKRPIHCTWNHHSLGNA